MTIQSIELTSAERNLIEVIFGNLTKTKADTARMVKAVRTAFETRAINRRIEKFDGKARKAGIAPLSWDNLVDPADYLESLGEVVDELNESLPSEDGKENQAREAALDRVEKLGKLVKRFEGIVEDTRTFTIDDLYLRWLRDLMINEVDLSKRVTMGPNGVFSESIVPVGQDQIEVFAALVEKVGDAVAAAPAGEKSK